jgi:hypothetical protein
MRPQIVEAPFLIHRCSRQAAAVFLLSDPEGLSPPVDSVDELDFDDSVDELDFDALEPEPVEP